MSIVFRPCQQNFWLTYADRWIIIWKMSIDYQYDPYAPVVELADTPDLARVTSVYK